jgi:RNA polymerase sigma-70 factor (ECF subfamily)
MADPGPKPAGGDDQRLAELFRDHAGFVWRVVQRLGVPEADAEDAVQEVFLVVARRLEAYEERGVLRAWLVAIARQVAQHAQRARFRQARKARELPPPEAAADPHQALERNQAVAFVNDFLAELDRDQALVFYLAEIEGMTAPEIAGSLQLNVNTVYGRLRMARSRFEARVQRTSRMERRRP